MKRFGTTLSCTALMSMLAGPAWAQVHVNVEVQGLEPPLKTNVLASLSIEQYKEYCD